MKVIKEYEADDIDLKDNLHGVLATGLLIGMITVSGLDKNSPVEKVDRASKQMVASFLNMLERSGYTIVPKDIPPAFLDQNMIS